MLVESQPEGRLAAGPRASILGREQDLAAIRAFLAADEVQLLTLTGPGGVGKTRLAVEVGHEVRTDFAQGVVFVDLTSVRDPDNVLAAVGKGLAFQDLESPLLLERLQAYLTERELLLILDNVEQVLPAASRLAALLAVAPKVRLLVTSREALHLRREQVFHVEPLSLPDPTRLPQIERLAQVPSVALFLTRAQTLAPSFVLTEENAPAVAELVVHLDGLPLAIELAAARITVLSPSMMLDRLGQRLSLLRWRAHDLPQRQQTLRSAIAWSYDLLSCDEQRLFRYLGVFAGRFSLSAAESIAEPVGVDAIEGLASLVDKHLVQTQGGDGNSARYVFLESLREYALERLTETGELEEARRAHALYYLALAEQADPELLGREQRLWIGRLERARENIRTALRWLIDNDDGAPAGGYPAVRMAAALGYFWEARGYMVEGRRLLEEALARVPCADDRLRAKALNRFGSLLMWTAGDKEGADRARELERAKAHLTEGLELARSVHDPLTIARSHSCLAVLGVFTGEWDASKRHMEEALTSWQEAGHAWGIASYFFCLGVVEFSQGNHERAAQLLERGVALYGECGDESAQGRALSWLANSREAQGDLSGEISALQDLLLLAQEANDPRLLLLATVGVIWVRRHRGDSEQLARLLGAAEAMRRATGIANTVNYRTRVELAQEALRSRLSQEGLDAALAAGRSMQLDQMAALLDAALRAGAAETSPEQSSSTILSSREQEVLRLVAEGYSNKQIARRLILSENTVKTHVTSLFNKLGVDSRAQAVAVAAHDGLL